MWYVALLVGITGSLHCAGMCSPLLMVVTNLTPSVVINRIVYNGGRLLTYVVLGFAFSNVGSILPIGNYQNTLSIAFGVVLLLAAVLQVKTFNIKFVSNALSWLLVAIKNKFSYFLQRKSIISMFTMGMLNGILPCGMTFMALTYCLLLSPLQGSAFMLFFGIGTLPVMLGLAPVIYRCIKKINISMKTAVTSMMIISGIVLIARTFVHTGVETMSHNTDGVDIVICR